MARNIGKAGAPVRTGSLQRLPSGVIIQSQPDYMTPIEALEERMAALEVENANQQNTINQLLNGAFSFGGSWEIENPNDYEHNISATGSTDFAAVRPAFGVGMLVEYNSQFGRPPTGECGILLNGNIGMNGVNAPCWVECEMEISLNHTGVPPRAFTFEAWRNNDVYYRASFPPGARTPFGWHTVGFMIDDGDADGEWYVKLLGYTPPPSLIDLKLTKTTIRITPMR